MVLISFRIYEASRAVIRPYPLAQSTSLLRIASLSLPRPSFSISLGGAVDASKVKGSSGGQGTRRGPYIFKRIERCPFTTELTHSYLISLTSTSNITIPIYLYLILECCAQQTGIYIYLNYGSTAYYFIVPRCSERLKYTIPV
jgi:hypothetical protein